MPFCRTFMTMARHAGWSDCAGIAFALHAAIGQAEAVGGPQDLSALADLASDR
jgi:hypothetical protein